MFKSFLYPSVFTLISFLSSCRCFHLIYMKININRRPDFFSCIKIKYFYEWHYYHYCNNAVESSEGCWVNPSCWGIQGRSDIWDLRVGYRNKLLFMFAYFMSSGLNVILVTYAARPQECYICYLKNLYNFFFVTFGLLYKLLLCKVTSMTAIKLKVHNTFSA